ncbi:MAG: hypothetical protein HY966_04025, partial [Ignavibacteriales bacterium]|nr:hypothetical protein [Ignavibacteriales bacterium]
MKTYQPWILLFALCVGWMSSALAQVSPYVTTVRIPDALEGHPLSISIELAQQEQIKRVVMKFRQFGESEYKELEMLISGRTAIVRLPEKSITPPYIEYFVELTLTSGRKATYPVEFPETNPQKIQVKPTNPKDREVRILSPEEGETVAVEDLAVAVSLFYASDHINRQATRIFLDGIDVTKEAVLTDDAILYSPKNFDRPLDLGTHTLRIELKDKAGQPYHSIQSNFNLSTALAIEEKKAELQLLGSGQVEFRNEKIDTVNTQYLRGDFQTSGSWKF